MYVYLSYPLQEGMVGFPSTPVYWVGKHDIIGVDGAAFNTSIMTIPNHYGTHCDGPRHFNPVGEKLVELPPEYFIFKGDDILVLDIPKTFKEVLTPEDVKPYEEQLKKAKLLLIRTGFEKERDANPKGYKYENPSATPEFCKYLVENFPDLRSFGFDSLSLASACNNYGVEAHHWLLGCYTKHFITCIEDMKLSPLEGKKVKSIVVAPIRAIEIDSAPVTVIAEVE